MEQQEKKPSKIEQAAEDLFNYAIDRQDVKRLMENLAAEADIKRTTVEYELPILKKRLDIYVNVLGQHPDVQDPATVIGSEFAGTCGNADDIFTFMTGSKMFISAVGRVKEYLKKIKLR